MICLGPRKIPFFILHYFIVIVSFLIMILISSSKHFHLKTAYMKLLSTYFEKYTHTHRLSEKIFFIFDILVDWFPSTGFSSHSHFIWMKEWKHKYYPWRLSICHDCFCPNALIQRRCLYPPSKKNNNNSVSDSVMGKMVVWISPACKRQYSIFFFNLDFSII